MILRAIYFRNWTGQVLSTYIFWLFQSGTGEFDLCPAFLSMELLNWWFHNFPQMIKIFDKTTFPNSIFKFCKCFLLLFINFICEMKNINDFAYLRLIVRKHSLEKQPPQNLFYCLFLWRCWKCPEYIAISQNTWKSFRERSFFVILLVFCCGFICKSLIYSQALGESLFKQLRLGTSLINIQERIL